MNNAVDVLINCRNPQPIINSNGFTIVKEDKPMNQLLQIMTLAIGLTYPLAASADTKEVIVNRSNLQIAYEEVDGKSFLYYKGYIDSGSGIRLKRMFMTYDPDMFVISSGGGLVTDAYMIGRHIADHNISVIVEKNSLCMSACAMIVMASDDLTIEGKIGFHTPYLTFLPTEFSIIEALKNHSRDISDFVNYFHENGYSNSLVNDILRQTSKNTFITFDNEQDLLSFRTYDIDVRPENYYSLYKIEEM